MKGGVRMANEQFIEIPYAGVNPNKDMAYSVGIDTTNNYRVSSYIINSEGTAVPVYCSKVANSCYFFAPSTGMKLYATNSSSNEISNISTSYNIVGTSVKIYYGSGVTNVFVPSNYYDLTGFTDLQSAAIAFLALFPDDYVNIRYVGNGCSLGGLSYVATGTGVLVPVTLPIGAFLTADNISVTKNGASIDFNYNPQTQQIAFTAI